MKNKSLLFLSFLFCGLLLTNCGGANSGNDPEPPAHEHRWGNPTYDWADDFSSCTAKIVCLDNSEHIETETKNSVYTIQTEADCLTDGQGLYTVTFEDKKFETQTHEVKIDQKGHSWGAPTYEWNDDFSKCVATRVCSSNSEHKETEMVDSTYSIISESTCNQQGLGRFTATFTNTAFTVQTHEINLEINPEAHNYVESVVEATADEEGYTLHTCEHCHDSYKTNITSAENKFIYEEYGNGYKITGYTGEAEIINVPATHNGLEVKFLQSISTGRVVNIPDSITLFGGWCFENNKTLEEVNIPNGTTDIPNAMFSDCSALKAIVIPDSVTSIGQYAFQRCSSLEEITLPFIGREKNSTAYRYLNCIFGGYTYDGGDKNVPQSLKKVILSSACTEIPGYAFYKCKYLEEVVIGENVTKIMMYAFGDTEKIKEVNIPKNVSEIESQAFASLNGKDRIEAINVDAENENYSSDDGILYNKDKTKLLRFPSGKDAQSFAIPNVVTEIGDNAFRRCEQLLSISMNDNVETLNAQNFYGCVNVTSITLSNAIKDIPAQCFKACKNLRSITLPNRLETIGRYAFDECNNLTSITIPATVIRIEAYAFTFAIQSIIFEGNIRNIVFEEDWNKYLNRITPTVGGSEKPYGIKINNETYVGASYEGFGSVDGQRRYLQFYVYYDLTIGDEFVFYDDVAHEAFSIALDPYSLGGTSSTSEAWKEYLAFDGTKYTVRVSHVYAFFIKIDGSNNNVYIQ
ncbi:MAG: leucine-rich repeat domain-containing protein [Bacilli bacterium]|nr:leucine-rich repeat domain-containing protein [Bacilli bacterium]